MFIPLISPKNTKDLFIQTLLTILVNFGVTVVSSMVISMLLLASGREVSVDHPIFLEYVFYACLILTVIIWRFLIKGQRLFSAPPRWEKITQYLIHANLVVMIAFIFYNGLASSLVEFTKGGWELLLPSFWASATAGIGEEIWLRGLLFTAFLSLFVKQSQSLTKTALVTSVLFGLLHISNLMTGAEPMAVVQQVFYATCFGFSFAAIRVGYNNLWLPMLLHFLVDFHPTITEPVSQNSWGELLILFVPMATLALIALYRMDRQLPAYTEKKEELTQTPQTDSTLIAAEQI